MFLWKDVFVSQSVSASCLLRMLTGYSAGLHDVGSEATCLTVQVCALPELNPIIETVVTCQGGLCERQPARRGEQRQDSDSY